MKHFNELFPAQRMLHHWVEGNTAAKCSKCKKQIKSYNGITGLHCRWCHLTVSFAPLFARPFHFLEMNDREWLTLSKITF
jgi:hypothetical protein